MLQVPPVNVYFKAAQSCEYTQVLSGMADPLGAIQAVLV
jgi:hypothetical protein